MCILFLTFRSPSDCLSELLDLSKSLHSELVLKFSQVESLEAFKLGQIFDVDQLFCNLSAFHLKDGVVATSRDGRIKWETYGDAEFAEFWSIVCSLPQVTIYLL